MFARVARYDVVPDRTGEAIDAFRDAASELEGASGLKGGYVLADWEDGMDDSESKAASLRQQAAKSVDGAVVSVHNFDVPIEIGTAVSSTT
jgi:hypothetical protein